MGDSYEPGEKEYTFAKRLYDEQLRKGNPLRMLVTAQRFPRRRVAEKRRTG
jgi:hypothetical protein